MEQFDVFRDIAERTGGDIYIGVVGPVRTGKSTFIKRFMELLVLPNIADPHERDRARDALPQAAAGRTIMTTEPKFVPDEGVTVRLKDGLSFRVRLVDCVGYTVPAAQGYEDEHGPRMVLTPWFEYEVPFQDAAEIGTGKVISDHSTIGLVVTTDGSVTDIPRAEYVDAEERVIGEIARLGKPFAIVLNTARPYTQDVRNLATDLEAKHGAPVVPVDAQQMTADDVHALLEQVLYEFPVREVRVETPRWVEVLDAKHWLREKFEVAVAETVGSIRRLRDIDGAVEKLGSYEFVSEAALKEMDLGRGVATIAAGCPEALFYDVLEEVAGVTVEDKQDIMKMWRDLVTAKREYDLIADALSRARNEGYGVVAPRAADMLLEDPEVVKQGNRIGVRLRATAPSLHIIRADVETEVTPFIGAEKQGEAMVHFLMKQFEHNPRRLWEADFFGTPLHQIARDGIEAKLGRIPPNAQGKLQETLTRIVNEGSGGLICIII